MGGVPTKEDVKEFLGIETSNQPQGAKRNPGGNPHQKGAYHQHPHAGGTRPNNPPQRPPKPGSSPRDRIDFDNAVPDVMAEIVYPILMLTGKLCNASTSNVNVECKSGRGRRHDVEKIIAELFEKKEYIHGIHKFYMRQLQDMSQPEPVEREKREHHDSATEKQIVSRASTLVAQKSVRGTVNYAKSLMEENVKLQRRLESDTRHILIEETSQLIRKSRDKEELITELIDRNAALIDRLAAEMNAKISQDESALENISIGNRPMKVAEEYTLLTSNAWLDAKTELDRFFGEDQEEENKIKLLYATLIEAEKEASKMYDTFTSDMNKRLEEPLKQKDQMAVPVAPGKSVVSDVPVKKEGAGATELPINIETTVGDFLKTKADYVDLTKLCEAVKAEITKRKETQAFFHQHADQVAFTEYIKQCSRLGWKMAIQRPRMRFYNDQSTIDKPFRDGERFELAWGSNPKAKAPVVRYYKYPLLLHGDKPMAKGSVFVM